MVLALSRAGGGSQISSALPGEVYLAYQGTPATATSTATLTVAQLTSCILRGSPGSSAATYTLPTVALLEATVSNVQVGSSFELTVVNVDGSSSGVITLAVGTGWTLSGLATVVATAGTAQTYRLYKTGVGAWTIERK